MLEDAYKKYEQSAMNKTTIQGDVDAEHYLMINKTFIDNGQVRIHKTSLVYRRGTEEEAKRLAVSAITSKRERGGEGGITKYARGVTISPR